MEVSYSSIFDNTETLHKFGLLQSMKQYKVQKQNSIIVYNEKRLFHDAHISNS